MRKGASTIANAVGALYDAAEDERLWPDAMAEVAKQVGALGSCLYAIDPDRQISWQAIYGIDPNLVRQYSDTYAAQDNKFKQAIAVPNRVVVEGVTVERPRWYDGSEVDVEVYAAAGVRYSMGLTVTTVDGWSWMFGQHGPRDRGMFSAADARRYERMAVHATRAFRLDLLRRQQIGHAGSLAAAFDQLSIAAMLVSRDGRVVTANVAARELLNDKDGLRLSGGKLSPDDAVARGALAAIIGRCGAVEEDGVPYPGSAVAVPRADRRPLLVRVVPLGLGSASAPSRFASCLVLATDPDRQSVASAEAIAASFGLTPAEARVAVEAIRGSGAEDIAEATGITRESARTYLKRIMAKVSVQRHAELVRQLGAVPAVRADARNRPRP